MDLQSLVVFGRPNPPVAPTSSRVITSRGFITSSSSQTDGRNAIESSASQAALTPSAAHSLLPSSTSRRKESDNTNKILRQPGRDSATSTWDPVPDLDPIPDYAWLHSLDWLMPSYTDLVQIFDPILAQAILHSRYPRSGQCFCALVFYETQMFLNHMTTIQLNEHRPTDVAEFLDLLRLFMTPAVVGIFATACNFHESIAGPGVADHHVRRRTLLEHASELIEQLVASPLAVSVNIEPNNMPNRDLLRSFPPALEHGRWERFKKWLKRVTKVIQVTKNRQPQHDYIVTSEYQ
ncbi:hypothetical protein BKA66DRAFT_576106 [Pyrenochaeta sp. MPI-SDFR-AT-0127]|nr:hypothetical protein BKA66DRAFT_576106 [Pyrenochaeta sp. MPI-SDFR-AT-0127]